MEIKKYPVLKWLFKRYQEGSLDQQKKELVDEWFEQYHNNEPVNILSNADAKERIRRELSTRVTHAMQPALVYRMWHNTWLKIACALLVVTLTALYFYQPQAKKQLSAVVYHTITTGNKQVKNVVLDDGTEIWLNSATRIRVSQSFKTEKNRIVYLDKGEAFFQVKHNALRPFSVISGNLITRDIGTSFNIRAYDFKNEYRVAVASGKVDVMLQGRAGELQPISAGITQGQVLNYNPQTYTAQIARQDAGLISGWKSGNQFYVNDLTLAQIGDELSRHFDLAVTVTHPEYDTNKYSLHLGNQSIREILQQLTLKTGMSYRLQNNSLTINPLNKLNEVKQH